MSRSILLLLVAVPSAFLMACGSDTTSGTTSGGGSAPTTTTGAGGAGGSASTSSATGTGGDATTTATSTSSTGTGTSSSASGSTGTGMMATGACTNAADVAVAQSKDVKKIAQDCGTSKLGQEPATKDCIKTGTGLSDGCVTCFDAIVQCVVMKCLAQCASDPNSAACNTCRDTNCNPAFVTCSGLPSN